MQTEVIKTGDQIPESLEQKETRKINFNLDGNLGLQLALISGIAGVVMYLFSCACPN